MQLRKECEWLKDENERLVQEIDVLKRDCQKLRQEHEQLTTTNRTLEDTPSGNNHLMKNFLKITIRK